MIRRHLNAKTRRELKGLLGVSDWEIDMAERNARLLIDIPDMTDPETDTRCFEITFLSPKSNREASIIFMPKHFDWEEAGEETRPLPPEPGCWNPWPDSAPLDDSPMLVKYNVGNRTEYAIGRYESESRRWLFDDTYYGEVFFDEDSVASGDINSFFYRPVEEDHEVR